MCSENYATFFFLPTFFSFLHFSMKVNTGKKFLTVWKNKILQKIIISIGNQQILPEKNGKFDRDYLYLCGVREEERRGVDEHRLISIDLLYLFLFQRQYIFAAYDWKAHLTVIEKGVPCRVGTTLDCGMTSGGEWLLVSRSLSYVVWRRFMLLSNAVNWATVVVVMLALMFIINLTVVSR